MKDEKSKAGKIRVMLVDDHQMMRDAIRNIIILEPDLTVVAEVENGSEALDSLRRANPDVVLMDASMPGMNGMETTRQLRKLRPTLKIIGVTLYEQTTYVDEMIEAGASGYVLKSGAPSEIVKAIRTVAKGGTYFDRSIPRPSSRSEDQRPPQQELSPKELAVAKLLAWGMSKTEVAGSLGVSIEKVDARRASVMRKLGLRNRAELVRVANKRGWLET